MPVRGGVFPRKGKGWGIAGEAAFPDLLDYWDQRAQWQSWRKGMALAYSAEGSVQTRLEVVNALVRPVFEQDKDWLHKTLLSIAFPSGESPQGEWNVVMKPRGASISPTALLAPSGASAPLIRAPATASQHESIRIDPATGESLRVLVVTGATSWAAASDRPLSALVGELLEDTIAPGGGALAATDGHALLCLQVDPRTDEMVFDATRLWRYEERDNGSLVLRQVPVAAAEPPPWFKAGRALTQAMTISCNCPAHLGVEYARLGRDLKIGVQGAFPTQGGQEVFPNTPSDSGDIQEGVLRQFRALAWERIPGKECKHCAAVRFLVRAPVAEPTDMPSLTSDYWRQTRPRISEGGTGGQKREALDELEELSSSEVNSAVVREAERFLDVSLGWENLDLTLLAAAAGDALTVFPTRVDPVFATPGGDNLPTRLMRSAADSLGTRFNESHFSPRPETEDGAIRGDWWVGRGTSGQVFTYDGPHQVVDQPALTWGTKLTANLVGVFP
jgi:hypothetical protein